MATISKRDLDLKQAFTEMHVTKLETSKKLKMLDMQIEVLKNSQRKYIITDKEITDLSPDTRVYSSVGRMFAQSTVPEIREELMNKEQKCKNLVTQMDEKKLFLLKSLKEQEDNLRDLVQSHKDTK